MSTTTVETRPCFRCGQQSRLEVPTEGLQRWEAGALIQEAFPTLDHETRETLMSGFHPTCWRDIFGDGEELDG